MKKIKKLIAVTLVFTFSLSVAACGNKKNLTNDDNNKPLVTLELSDDAIKNAQIFMEFLKDEKNDEIYAMTSKAFKDKVDSKSLAIQNSSIFKQLGKIKDYNNFRVKEGNGIKYVLVYTLFEKGEYDLKIVFNNDNKTVEGYFLEAPDKSNQVQSPIDNEHFKSEEVTFGSDPFKVKGTLLLPKNISNPPVVVLVQGSGPSDRDETINGVNKPFKDIAEGLVKEGIAVLRYDKRTYAYGKDLTQEQIQGITPNFETIDDAVLGVKYLKTRNDVDKSSIFVLGHSLGGYLLPAISNSGEDFKGAISLAGTIDGDFEDLIKYQYNYLANIDGVISDDEKSAISQVEAQVELVKKLKNGESVNEKLILGMGHEYWKYLNNYNQLEDLKNMNKPTLILQGERDYQVPMSHFKIFQSALKNNSNITFKSYSDLNHLFMSGAGAPNPEEYATPSNVNKDVIRDIAEFINK